jgi:hypothetical protein
MDPARAITARTNKLLCFDDNFSSVRNSRPPATHKSQATQQKSG